MARALIKNTSVVTGTVMASAGTTAPTGYLLCDGSAVSRTTYSNLFAIIGITHGQGDGSTTFNLPDYRGRFLRGVDGGIARDPDRTTRTAMAAGGNTGNNVGSIQDDAFQGHFHEWSSTAVMSQTDGSVTPMNYLTADSTNGGGGTATATFQAQNYVDDPKTGNHGTVRVSTESRSKNAYVNYIIAI